MSVGRCPLCQAVIWKYRRKGLKIEYGAMSIDFVSRPYAMNELGREFWILSTDGSRMRVAICKDCLEHLDTAKVKRVFDDIIYTKLEHLKKLKDEVKKYGMFRYYRQLDIWHWAKEEKDIVGYLNIVKKNG